MRLDLFQYLKHSVQISHPLRATASAPIYVLGNPSADLDSIISAILYSYFASAAPGERTRQYVPVINLPDVRSGTELWRLRPEFVTALRLANSSDPVNENGNLKSGPTQEQQRDAESLMLEESILTIADLKERFRSQSAVRDGGAGNAVDDAGVKPLDVVMVDWNCLLLTSPGERETAVRLGVYEGLRISILGCIDHHEDESFIPARSETSCEPRCIQTGVGSCASLIVRELRSREIWKEESRSIEPRSSSRDTQAVQIPVVHEAELAKLALAAILADTANMTAESKVSDIDRAAVSFLEGKVQTAVRECQQPGTKIEWNRKSFYEEIMLAKSNSVENLTMDEILGRDYKEWTETSQQSGKPVKIGICNVVRPISWILDKASQSPPPGYAEGGTGDYGPLFGHLSSFSRTRGLDIVVLMTVFTGPPPNNEFNRELLVWDLNDGYKSDLEHFENVAVNELGLVPWHPDQKEANTVLAPNGISEPGYTGLWHQKDVTKSRKQIAPLLRNVLTGKLSRF